MRVPPQLLVLVLVLVPLQVVMPLLVLVLVPLLTLGPLPLLVPVRTWTLVQEPPSPCAERHQQHLPCRCEANACHRAYRECSKRRWAFVAHAVWELQRPPL